MRWIGRLRPARKATRILWANPIMILPSVTRPRATRQRAKCSVWRAPREGASLRTSVHAGTGPLLHGSVFLDRTPACRWADARPRAVCQQISDSRLQNRRESDSNTLAIVARPGQAATDVKCCGRDQQQLLTSLTVHSAYYSHGKLSCSMLITMPRPTPPCPPCSRCWHAPLIQTG